LSTRDGVDSISYSCSDEVVLLSVLVCVQVHLGVSRALQLVSVSLVQSNRVLPDQLYFALYGGKGTKAERALQRMDTIEFKEREQKRLQPDVESSSSEDGENDTDEYNGRNQSSNVPQRSRVAVPDVISEEEEECRKYVYVGQAVDSQADLETMRSGRSEADSQQRYAPVRPARPSKDSSASANGIPSAGISSTNGGNVSGPATAANRLVFKETIPVVPRVQRSDSEESKKSVWGRIKEKIPLPSMTKTNQKKGITNGQDLDILAPNFTNTYDVLDEKKQEKRAKRDKKLLTNRLRRRIREELREAARLERQRKKMADAIELLLQLLRMMTSFAVLVGNIRKTFIPAQFKYLKPGQHAYDHYELLLLFRVTTFLDVSMFWTNVMWVYCLQWHLCCRLGFMRFWMWLGILSTIAVIVMLIPMSYSMNQLDLSWCRFLPNSTLEKYQPKW
uniref:G_PROTEIN_RECEP_F1_2 domain-containing protein n=1 Tax=Nippostrongylus brasiliensis TaxID=27835 RepID=A0A0N4Y0Q4_NIPBR